MNCKCDYADERDVQGYCKRMECKCNGCGDIFVDKRVIDRMKVIERKDVCKNCSIFGNYFCVVNAQDVANLIAGKCLALTGEEYNFFLSYDGGEVVADDLPGHWEKYDNSKYCYCSKCGKPSATDENVSWHKYCPVCGTQMSDAIISITREPFVIGGGFTVDVGKGEDNALD